MKKSLVLAFVAVAVFASGCVAADRYESLEGRIAVLEAQTGSTSPDQGGGITLAQLKTELDAYIKSSRENYAELKYDLAEMKENYYRLQGVIEEIRHNFGTSDQARKEELEKRLGRLDNAISQNFERIIALEKYMGFEPTRAQAAREEIPGSEPAEPETEQGAYDQAKALFDQGDREGARLRFENFINKFPESKNADNARFWIAETYYAEKWFEKAILEYQKVLETYPDSNKAAAARLKQGYAFAELGEKANARLILKELIKRHPETNEAKYAAEKLKGLQ